MQFINATGNSIKLNDTGKIISYIGEQPQEISTDEINRSKMFQMLCIGKKFIIVSASSDRIEQNLYRLQNGLVAEPLDRIEVMVRGHFYSNTGYGKSNRNLVYALGRAGVRVGIETGNESNSVLNQMELTKISRFRRFLPNAICIDSMIPCFSEKSEYRYRILNTTVEAASVPQQFVDICNEYDEVWVASDFCKQVFEDHGVEKSIFVIPNAIDSHLYNPNVKPHKFKPTLKRFVFISVMSWSYRKGYDVLLKAYLKEFSNKDDTTLLIVSAYDGIDDVADEYIKKVISDVDHAHVARCGREIAEFEMPRIYKACDCFVLPSRGEGFGLPYIEAGMCGIPIIATLHSGQTMFLNKSNAYMLEIDRLSEIPSGTTGVHYWDEQLFPELTDDKVIEELGKLMRSVYEDYDEAKRKSELLKQSLVDYTLESVGQKAVERLRSIWTSLS